MENTQNIEEKEEKNVQNKKRNKIIIIVIIILLLLLILVKLYFEFKAERQRIYDLRAQILEKNRIALEEKDKNREEGKSLKFADSSQKIESEEKEIADSLQKVREKEIADNSQKAKKSDKSADSLRQIREKEIADSIAAENAKKALEEAAKGDCKDTATPWVYPEPTGGVHFEPIKVSFFVSKPCSVFYKRSKDAEFKLWKGENILISDKTELYYYALDSCQNLFSEQKKVYEFRERQTQNVCPNNMAFIENPNGNFCIDQYLWANKKGVLPVNMVSQTAARDSCASLGKRLCTAEEWTAACKGPYLWKYPYGNAYMPRACVTQDSVFRRSGEASECRGWYAVYDMSGNLAEWTSTRSTENNRFFIVKGGFWESGQSGDCETSRYSYYPQNQHNPVGFRCCKSLE
ncbi:MAG: SUMF1/EgtB/PvdO family nonheme iron enzyme [Chitinivibrionia bacterium]|nr:SUMF1/EgtB/PvdO family nonheme iron enzyme [Chitinivibrionia bacterium]